MFGIWESNRKAGRVARRSSSTRLSLEALEDRVVPTAGALDLTFGAGGRVVNLNIGEAFGSVLQADGKIVAVGGFNGDIIVARYNPGGSFDSSFGTNGLVTTDLGSDEDQAEGVAIQPDGKIVVAGFTTSATTGADFAVVRYNTDGSLDSTFGTGGIVTTDFDGLDDKAADVALQQDGKIVVAGTATIAANSTAIAVARYNTDGTLDSTFGTGGKVTTQIGQFDLATREVIQPDQKILVAGANGFEMARYNPNGSLDTTFGTGGTVQDFPDGGAQAVALRPDGTIVLAGTEINTRGDAIFLVAQFTPSGAVDTSFGPGGSATTTFAGNDATAFSVVLQNDGSVIVGGSINSDQTLIDQWALSRFTSTGTLDLSFGQEGRVITNMGSEIEQISTLLIPADGKVLAVGLNDSGIALAQYLVPPPQPIDVSANAQYVDQLYLALLGRQSDPAGRAYFTNILDVGNHNRFLTPAQQLQVARMQVVQLFELSVEFRTNEVNNLYQSILGRAADAQGLNQWVTVLGLGATITQVEAELFGSEEFIAENGGTPDSFIQAVYAKILGRTPDAAGEAAWVSLLNAGESTESVVTSILRSSEAETLVVSDLYNNLLSRAPDAAGLASYVDSLVGGISNEYVIQLFAASPEFYNNAQST